MKCAVCSEEIGPNDGAYPVILDMMDHVRADIDPTQVKDAAGNSYPAGTPVIAARKVLAIACEPCGKDPSDSVELAVGIEAINGGRA